MRKLLYFFGVALIGCVALASQVSATPGLVKSCIKAGPKSANTIGMPAADAENLIKKIARSIGLNTVDVKILNCGFIDNAEAFYSNGDGAPEGEYIVYNPGWMKAVAGDDITQAYTILGHELGHLVGRHFFKSRMTSHDRELEADSFAGCAVGNMGGQWSSLESILHRLRPEVSGDYPSADESIAAARQAFEACSHSPSPTALQLLSVNVDTLRSTFRMSKTDLSIHAERDSLTRLSIEYDREMLTVFEQASCRGIRGDEPIRDALPIWRKLLAARGRSESVAKIASVGDYRLLLNDHENTFEELRPTTGEMSQLLTERPSEYKIMMRWLVECVGVADPVLIWTFQNNSDKPLILSSVDYQVLDVGQVKGAGPATVDPIDIEAHELVWEVGVQTRTFSPQIRIAAGDVVAVRIRYLFDTRDWGLTWLLKPVFHALGGASVVGPELKFFAAKGKPLP